MVREFAASRLLRERAEQEVIAAKLREPTDADLIPLETFLRDNTDSSLWSAAQTREVVERTAKMTVRLRRRLMA